MNTTIIDLVIAWLGQTSWQVAVMVILVVAAECLLRERLSVRWRSVLWTLVFVRLCLPVIPASPWSVYNMLPADRLVEEVRTLRTDRGTTTRNTPTTTVHLGPVETAAAGEALPARPTGSGHVIGLTPLVVSIWGAGAMVFLGVVVIRSVRMHRRLRRAPRVSDPAICAMIEDARGRLHVRRHVDAVISDEVGGPAMTGVFRPRLILPASTLSALSAEQIRLVILHEVAHVKRHDVLLNWGMTFVTMLHWFNPLVYLVGMRCREHREILCDQMVVAAMGSGSRRDYGAVLLRVVELVHRPTYPAMPGFVGIFGRRPMIQRRITMLMSDRSRTLSRQGRWIGVLTACVLAGATLTDAAPLSSDPPPSDPNLVPGAGAGGAVGRLLPGVTGNLVDDDVTLIVYDVRDLLPEPAADASGITHRVYRVKAGDTLASISRQYMGSVDLIDRILKVNPDLDANRLAVGQTLLVPGERTDASGDGNATRLAEIRRIVSVLSERLPKNTSIQEMNGNLIIATTEGGHAMVQDQLNDFRAASLMVDIQAQFVRELDPMLAELDVRLVEMGNLDVPGAWSVAMIDTVVADTLLSREIGDLEVLSAPRVLVRDRQTASIAVGQPVTLTLPDVTDPQELVDVEPFSGLSLQLQPIIAEDRRSIELGMTVDLSEIDVTVEPVLECSATLEATLRLQDEGTILIRLADPERLRLVSVQPAAPETERLVVAATGVGSYRILTVPEQTIQVEMEPIYLIVRPRILLPERVDTTVEIDPNSR